MFDDAFIFDNNDRLSLFYDEPVNAKNQLVQTLKLFDGLFLTNIYAGQDPEFLINNKIGLIVNCHPLELSLPQPTTRVLPYNFHTKRGCVQQSISIVKIGEIFKDIQHVLHELQQGVIILSKTIDSRNFCFAGIYLMAKYGWNVDKFQYFLRQKKQEMDIAEKYKNILNAFEKNNQRNKLSSIFQPKHTKLQQKVIENTLTNSIAHHFPNFQGFSHLRQEYSSQMTSKKRSIKFLEEIEVINQSIPITEPKPFQNDENKYVQVRPFAPKKATLKLSSVQSKLKTFIRQKCQQSDRFSKLSSLQLPTEQTTIKRQDLVPRRKVVSKTEESVDVCQQEEEEKKRGRKEKEKQRKIKTNNFLESSIILKDNRLQKHHKQKNTMISDFLNQNRPKMHSACSSNSQIPKRCYTQATNHTEKESHGKVNSLFKISKNKVSSKKMHQHPHLKSKGYTIKSSQKHFRHLKSQMGESESGFDMQRNINSSLEAKKEEEIKGNMVNYNVNIHIDTLNLIEGKLAGAEASIDYRKNSQKVKKRTLPKRIIRQHVIE